MLISRVTIAAFACAVAIPAQAANVVNVTGPSPFGITGELADVVSWTQSASYSNVTITMPLEDLTIGGPISGVEGTVYLVNQIGAGTTSANQVTAPVTISSLTASFATRTLFSGLTLPAGTYYLVIVRTNTRSLVVEGSSIPVVTLGAGVTDQGEAFNTSALAPFPPASAFTGFEFPTNIFVTIAGDAAPVTPVPSSLIMTLTGLAVAVFFAGVAKRNRVRRAGA